MAAKAQTVRVFTAAEALAAVKSDPKSVLTIEKKKEEKEYQGTTFFNNKFKIAGESGDGFFTVENIPLAAGMADPANKEDQRNKFEGTRMQLEYHVERAGAWGQFLRGLNPEFDRTVREMDKAGTLVIGKREVHPLYQTHYSDDHKDAKLRAQPVPADKQKGRFKIEIDEVFPAKYPHKFLVGQPKTIIYDARTERKVVKDGKEIVEYDVATVDGQPLNKDNIHKFVTNGSVIVKARIMMPSTARSSKHVSLPQVANKVILMPGGAGGFSDDDFGGSSTPAPAAETVKPEVKPEAKPDTTPAAVPAKPEGKPAAAPAGVDEINSALNDL